MDLTYGLNDKVPLRKAAIYMIQHVIFFLASAIPMPIVVGVALGLNQIEIADMLQRTFLLCGIITMLQILLGHRFPIFDGPAGLWAGLLVVIAGSASQMGKPTGLLKTDLETGILIAGAFVMIIAAAGLIPKLIRQFTPIVNGVVLLLMVFQISPGIVRGMTGISSSSQYVDPRSLLLFFITVGSALFINLFLKGFVKSISSLIGALAGWGAAILLGMAGKLHATHASVVSAPLPFPWGRPTFDIGITLTCIIAALMLISMVYASIMGMADTIDEEIESRKFSKSIFIYGLATALAGVFPTVPYMPYISSIGVVVMTRLAARLPMLVASGCMVLLGLFRPVGLLFATIPLEVGYGVLVIVFSLILTQGVKELQKQPLETRESFVIGLPMLIGIGIMFLPSSSFSNLPGIVQYIFSNGLIDGVLLALLLNNLLLRNGKKSEPDKVQSQ